MPPKSAKPRAVRSAKPVAASVRPVRTAADIAALARRAGYGAHWGWVESLIRRLDPEAAIAVGRVATAGATVLPETLVSVLRSRAEPAVAAPEDALVAARRAVRLAPGDSVAILHLAQVLRQAGDDIAAQAALRAAVLTDTGGALLNPLLGAAPEPPPMQRRKKK